MNDFSGSGLLQGLPLGRMLQSLRGLSNDQIDAIVAYQERHGMQFGQAAVALSLATDDDIVSLISKQFHYPYEPKANASSLSDELVVAKDPFSDGAEVFRDLRTQLIMGPMKPADSQGRVLAVVSPQSGDGKTFLAANLAAAFSQLGVRTLLVDANMRQPRAGALFAPASDAAGLSMILSGRSVKQVVRHVPSLPNMFVLPAGPIPPNPQELLQSAAYEQLLEELRREFDHIVVDTPPADAGADLRMVAARSDCTLVVARQDRTPYESLARLVKTLERDRGVPLAGVVMNRY